MGRLASSIILCLCLLQVFFACDAGIGGLVDGDGPEFVTLDVSVALSDISGNDTRAGDHEAANDNERMQSLRIVIVRPDGMVEANRRIDLQAAVAHEYESFKVAANERKAIYLFVNEDTETVSADNISRKVVDYDLAGIKEGRPFPENELATLTIKLDSRVAQVAGPLPMSGMHYVDVPGHDHSCKLFVTRAAVKFTFRISNNSTDEIGLGGVTISKMAREEWYIPRARYDENRKVIEYEVPDLGGDNGYYIFRNDFAPSVPISVGGELVLNPIYLLEGKYNDVYSMSIFIDGKERYSGVLDNLPELPRNTHVVVNIVIRKNARITWEVDVLPYEIVDLRPGFGE